jgi:ACS family hexuronate transporter-like MFS transporter
MRKLVGLRWYIVALVFLASVLNYVDRQTLSILAPTIQKDLMLSDADYAWIVNVFLVAYTIAYLVSGRIADRLGARVAFPLFIAWWSIANMLTPLARGVYSLGAFRFLLGLGEAGNWTTGSKVVAEWFPRRERALAWGLCTLGATIGATIAPPLVTALNARWGWHGAFVVTGVVGLVWLVPWLLIYRRPEEHPLLPEREREALEEDRAAARAEELQTPGEEVRVSAILRRPIIWGLVLARLITDPVWYFYQFWLAKYLFSARGIPQEQLGITWVVFLAADIGTVLGGWLSGRLLRRGRSTLSARMTVMLACAALMPLAVFIPGASSLNLALGIAMLMVLAHMAWLVNLSTMVVDLVPQKAVATVFGIVAAGSTVGGIFMNKFVERTITDSGYGPIFTSMVFLHPLAFVILLALGARGAFQTRQEPVTSAR